MRYALHAKCDKEYLRLADEIIVDYKEKERILDYPELYPNAAVTIHSYENSLGGVDWIWLQSMSRQFKDFSVGVSDKTSVKYGISAGVKTYLLKHINNFAELNELMELGVCYIYVDQPLFSSCDKLKVFNIPIRWTPTLVDSSAGYLQRPIHGTWIRPEDLHLYDIVPNCIAEFDRSLNGSIQEQAYFKFYAQKKTFPSSVDFLWPEFKNLYTADEWLIDSQLTKHRMNCHQRCEEVPKGNGCHMCEHGFGMANAQKITDYINEIKNNKNQETQSQA